MVLDSDKPDTRVIGKYGEVPREILRPTTDTSWMANDICGADVMIVLGHLSCTDTCMWLPACLNEAARLGVRTVAGVIEPWEVIDRKLKRPDRPNMQEYISSLRSYADSLIVLPDNLAVDARLHLNKLLNGASVDEATSKAFSELHYAETNAFVEFARAALNAHGGNLATVSA